MSKERTPLIMWTVYDHPKDFPNHYVARKFLVSDRLVPSEAIKATELDELREIFAKQGLYCLPRDPDDDPAIIETWL